MAFWWRKASPLDQERLEALERVCRRLCDDVDAIDDQLRKVKGLVYAKKIHKTGIQDDAEAPGEANGSTAHMSRQELKAWLARTGRFVPGKPVNHQE